MPRSGIIAKREPIPSVAAAMISPDIEQPLVFQPIFKERIWGGRRLEALFGKQLPPGGKIGESWEIVDREEAQSIVASGPLAGLTLHHLWAEHRTAIFGEVADAERFPLLVKLLDAEEKLSLQVHPPPAVASALNGEPKCEFWYIAQATAAAELYVGLKRLSSRAKIEDALRSGTVAEQVHRIAVRSGDAMFLPSGRMHAIGAGNVIVEVQQNSDTTFRVFDWNRVDESGHARELHVEESLRSIDFDDFEPALIEAEGESLVRQAVFEIEKWNLSAKRTAAPAGQFAIIVALSGEIGCAGISLQPGHCLLVPAHLRARELEPLAPNSSLLRVTLPG